MIAVLVVVSVATSRSEATSEEIVHLAVDIRADVRS
jgi:hypothetical protein